MHATVLFSVAFVTPSAVTMTTTPTDDGEPFHVFVTFGVIVMLCFTVIIVALVFGRLFFKSYDNTLFFLAINKTKPFSTKYKTNQFILVNVVKVSIFCSNRKKHNKCMLLSKSVTSSSKRNHCHRRRRRFWCHNCHVTIASSSLWLPLSLCIVVAYTSVCCMWYFFSLLSQLCKGYEDLSVVEEVVVRNFTYSTTMDSMLTSIFDYWLTQSEVCLVMIYSTGCTTLK